jgi:RNA polymerase sigma factor (sigma-70 family)
MRTSAEKHRLILSHVYLVPMLASGFRGAKGIAFDELEGAGMVGLVEAAASWPEQEAFVKYANVAICNQIRDFIRDWSAPPSSDELPVRPAGDADRVGFFEWQSWSDREFIYAISEYWENLIATPVELREAFDRIKNAGDAIRAAQIGFTRREREILNARYFSKPQSSIETIARHHKISNARVVFLIDRMLKKIRSILESREAATPTAVRG